MNSTPSIINLLRRQFAMNFSQTPVEAASERGLQGLKAQFPLRIFVVAAKAATHKADLCDSFISACVVG
jgi:hypothetical protein